MRAFVIGLVLGIGSAAHADTLRAPDEVPDADAPMAQARRLAASAQAHFDIGEYPAAIADFRAAYRHAPRPGFLYNLGQAYRLMGDCVSASAMYRQYLMLSNSSPHRNMVERHLVTIDDCVQRQLGGDLLTAVPSSPGRTSKRAGLALGATGLVMTGIGAYLAFDLDDVSTAARRGPGGRNDDDDDDDDDPPDMTSGRDGGSSTRTTATALIAGGVVATAAGATLYYLGWRDERRSAVLAVVPTAHGASASVGWRF